MGPQVERKVLLLPEQAHTRPLDFIFPSNCNSEFVGVMWPQGKAYTFIEGGRTFTCHTNKDSDEFNKR